MTLNTILKSIYSLFLTNYYGFKLRGVKDSSEVKRIRLGFSNDQLNSLNIKVNVINKEKIPQTGKYLVISNHRSVIDPPLIEVALQDSTIFGPWVSKKELYNSFFFGLFVRNAGSILLDREKSQMSGFFADVKKAVARDESIFIFPEGTRNKTDEQLTTFKEGSRIIALKNRLPILPIYIKSDADKVLQNSLKSSKKQQVVDVVVGDIIDYKDKTSLEENYKKAFSL